jgi:predicted Rossmann fold nucleotide-binding protein DprA/Smf involved in DNA uptake
LTESYLDVINEYKTIFEGICFNQSQTDYTPPKEHLEVWEKLKLEPLSADELAADIDYNRLILSLTALEVEGVIERNSEGRYALVKRSGV